MTTFTATIALEDDAGQQYDSADVLAYLTRLARTYSVELLSRTIGHGYDPEGPNAMGEPIVIVAGIGHADAVEGFGNAATSYAGTRLRQRAIGWVVDHGNTYRLTEDDAR